MNRKQFAVLVILFLLYPGFVQHVLAHGARIQYTTTTATQIEIVATFDSGEPMANAQVTIYAPDDPEQPWLTGMCDDEGRFTFIPDMSQSGTWDVQVRLAGHGDIIHIPIEGTNVIVTSEASYSIGQIILMTGSVIWGFVGTALFFMRRPHHAHS